MKFNSLIQNLKEIKTPQLNNYKLSTSALTIDQISHPINSERMKLFYEYAEANDVIQKFKNIVTGEISNFTEKKISNSF